MSDQRQSETIQVPRELLVRADSLLTLVRYRHRLSEIPGDVCRDIDALVGDLRATYEGRRSTSAEGTR